MGAVSHSIRGRMMARVGDAVAWCWDRLSVIASIGPKSRRGRRFGAFGEGSIICFPATSLMNERFIEIGENTMIGPHVALSAGMAPGQECLSQPVVRIGDRCLIGRGSGIVGHFSIDIGDDVWTGHHVYITDQNHGYDNVDIPNLADSLKLFRLGVSWGGFESLILPTRIGLNQAGEQNSMQRFGVSDRIVRLSLGLEDPNDLWADFEAALSKSART